MQVCPKSLQLCPILCDAIDPARLLAPLLPSLQQHLSLWGHWGSVPRPSVLGSCTLSTGDLNLHKAESSAQLWTYSPPMAFHHRIKSKVPPIVTFQALHEIVSACLSLCSVCVGFLSVLLLGCLLLAWSHWIRLLSSRSFIVYSLLSVGS